MNAPERGYRSREIRNREWEVNARWKKSLEIWSFVFTPPARRDPANHKGPIRKKVRWPLGVILDLDPPFDSYSYPPRHDQEIMGARTLVQETIQWPGSI